jgi:hypothetical protein
MGSRHRMELSELTLNCVQLRTPSAGISCGRSFEWPVLSKGSRISPPARFQLSFVTVPIKPQAG